MLTIRSETPGDCALKTVVWTLVLVAIVFSVAARTAAAEEFPVWWSPKLDLDALESIDAYLSLPLFPKQPEGVWLRNENRREVRAGTCNEFARLIGKGFYSYNPYKFGAALMNDSCEIARRLKSAQPARQSFVRNFVFDETAPDFLPAMLGLGFSCEWACRLHIANEYRISWSAIDMIEEVEVVTEYRVEIATGGSFNHVELMARADFNGDGLEDLLVRTGGSARGGTHSATSLYLLSRETDDSVFFVLSSQSHLCPTYTCDRQYDDPPIFRGLELP